MDSFMEPVHSIDDIISILEEQQALNYDYFQEN
jgi:hypothetical protein